MRRNINFSIQSITLLVCCFSVCFMISCGNYQEVPQLKKPEPIEKAPTSVAEKPVVIDESKVVAQWKGGQLTLKQIDRFVKPYENPPGTNQINPEMQQQYIAQERKHITDTLTGNYLLLLEAQKQGIELTDAEKEALLHKAKGNFESEESYIEYLKNAKQTQDDFLDVYVNLELGKKLVNQKEQEIWNGINEDSMQAYYQKNIHKFTPAHRSFFNRVDIHVKEDRTLEETKTLAENLHSQVADMIKSMTTLEDKRNVMRDMAKNHSDAFEATYNGGYVTMYHTPEFEEGFSAECMQTAKETTVGELSPVYRSQHGYGFLLPKTQSKSFTHPFETEAVQKMVPNMMLEEEMFKWRDELKQKYELEVFEDVYNEKYEPYLQQLKAVSVSTP